MIEFTHGNLFSADAEALVNPVNCLGRMGRGLAAQSKRAYPANYCSYVDACRSGELRIGRVLVVETGKPHNPRFIINFPTKRDWHDPSSLAYIDAGLAAWAREVIRIGIKSVAMPALGCGLYGLDWEEVKKMIEDAAKNSPSVHFMVFEPHLHL